jgi:GMP synthase (glutamine-hydrolysing)
MASVCIVVTGRPVPSAQRARGGFAEMVRRAASDAWRGEWLDFDATSEQPLPEARALVITGSPASVTERAGWMLRREAELARAVAAGMPILGICFGHQLLAQALGGRVEKNPRGREIGTVRFEPTTNDPLLASTQRVNMSHVDAVVELPPGARVLGTTSLDPFAALRFGEQAWGVQFHPEFDAEIVRCYVRERRQLIQAEGLEPAALEAGATDTPEGAAVLQRFLSRL